MSERILITGGAGFIGSHLVDELISNGYSVRVLDNLSPQVHGPNARRPAYLHPDAELLIGDVRDRSAIEQAINGVDVVFHFAAAVGVGQSMYEIAHYVSTNNLGTSVLLEALIRRPVQRLIVASCMSIYGEGVYQDSDGNLLTNVRRTMEQLTAHQWDLHDGWGNPLQPVATPESKPADIASVYALTKFDQERLCLIFGRAYGIETVALRFFNAYGPRQSLSNPYTGVLAIFASRILNNNPPIVYEDGNQRRDFVSVHDIARACRLAMITPEASGRVFNIGSGQAITIAELAQRMIRILGRENLAPQITHQHRVGDIRHCYADIRLAQSVLEYEPWVSLDQGLEELASWLQGQISRDMVIEAHSARSVRGQTL